MARLATFMLLLTYAGSVAAPCTAADKIDPDGKGSITVSFTKAGGADAISLRGPKSTVMARSLTLSDGGKTMTLTPHGKGIEMRFGTFVIRAKELEFRTMPRIKTAQYLKIEIKSQH